MGAPGHHVPRHRARGVEVFARKAFADDVAIGHHSNQPIISPDRNAADVVSMYQFRDFGDSGYRGRPNRLPCALRPSFMGDLRCNATPPVV